MSQLMRFCFGENHADCKETVITHVVGVSCKSTTKSTPPPNSLKYTLIKMLKHPHFISFSFDREHMLNSSSLIDFMQILPNPLPLYSTPPRLLVFENLGDHPRLFGWQE